jgi:sec-independent protein translocase protein TatC
MMAGMMDDEPKPFLDHLEDLRNCLLKCVGALAVGVTLAAIYTKQLLALMREPLRPALESRGMNPEQFLFILSPIDPMTLTFQTALFGGLIFALPLMLVFVGQFVMPALHPNERRLLLPGCVAAIGLFLTGVAFCYCVVLPRAMDFFIDWAGWLGAEPRYPYQEYISFVLQMLLGFGLSFELPLVIAVLAKLNLIGSDMLRAYRRYAVVVILVLAAVITPTSDPFTMMAMAVPMYLLFEAGIVVAWWIERNRQRAEREEM